MDVKPGDIFARVSHGTVVSVGGGFVEVRNEAGYQWRVGLEIVEREFVFADKHTREEKVTMAGLEQLFRGMGSSVFQVKFTKKPEVDAGVAAVTACGWDSATAAKRKKVIREVLKGEERTLIGRLDLNAYRTSKTDDAESLGRMKVIDMQLPEGESRARLVDLRTVTELIVDGVRYHR